MALKSPGKPGALRFVFRGCRDALNCFESVMSPRPCGSGSLAFPAPSFALAVASRAFEVFPVSFCRRPKALAWVARVPLPPLSRRPSPMREVGLPGCCHPGLTTRVLGEFRLASSVETIAVTASSPLAQALLVSLRGLRASTLASGCPGHPVAPPRLLLEGPSIGSPLWSSTPSPGLRRARDLWPVRASEQVSFRPRGFSPPRRFAPTARCRRCCSLLPILGFTAFRASHHLLPDPRESPVSMARAVPAVLSPLEDAPCRQLFRRSPPRPRRVGASRSGHAPLPFHE